MHKFVLITVSIIVIATYFAFKPDDSEKFRLTKHSFSELKDWHNGEHLAPLNAFKKSCAKLVKLEPNHNIGWPAGNVDKWQKTCQKAETTISEPKKFFEENFTPYKVSKNGKTNGLFTGYYEIELKGSTKAHGKYIHPIYAPPTDLVKPYYERKEIEEGALKGKNLELVYVDDPVRLFFLHIQGSGVVKLEDGSIMRVGYNGQNGHGYKSIGRYLVDAGVFELEEVTAQKIIKWLYDNPDQASDVMNTNKSYIFFRKLPGLPVGGQGVELTAEHSLAVDNTMIPYSVPIWLQTTLPENDKDGEPREYNRLLIAQDRGGAIKGAIRGDVFFGHGERAENLAGKMKQEGEYFLLLPKEVTL